MASIADNLKALEARMAAACLKAGRSRESVTLVAVSKFQPLARLREAADAGCKVFGESRQQEAQDKLPLLKDLGEWHFIGHLQSNKAKSVVELFDVIQSVDSSRLAEKIAVAAGELGKIQRIYAQVNISCEPQKHGFALQDEDEALLALAKIPGLKLEGLMGMAAAEGDPRPAFQALSLLRDRLDSHVPGLKLSMGMSQDFEIAIQEGADLIRVGTALFQ